MHRTNERNDQHLELVRRRAEGCVSLLSLTLTTTRASRQNAFPSQCALHR